MSLFEEQGYQYRETCFVLFANENRPSMAAMQSVLEELGDRYVVSDAIEKEGQFESVCVRCPDDHSAMDISFVAGEAVVEQLDEIRGEFQRDALDAEELEKLDSITQFDSRLDIFHFEQLTAGGPDDGLMDPGAMLVVLQQLAKLTNGVGVDAQSETII